MKGPIIVKNYVLYYYLQSGNEFINPTTSFYIYIPKQITFFGIKLFSYYSYQYVFSSEYNCKNPNITKKQWQNEIERLVSIYEKKIIRQKELDNGELI